jgi:hypothetical protein
MGFAQYGSWGPASTLVAARAIGVDRGPEVGPLQMMGAGTK